MNKKIIAFFTMLSIAETLCVPATALAAEAYPSEITDNHSYQTEYISDTDEGTVLFGDEIYKEGNFSLYDDANTSGSIEIWDTYGLQAVMGNDWNTDNGVKVNITEYVRGYSGRKFSISVNATNWAWNGDNGYINPLGIFFKIVGEDGEERITELLSGPDSAEEITENSVDLSGCAELSFEKTDTVYLCFVHGAGLQQYGAIRFAVLDEELPLPDTNDGIELFGNEIYKEGNFSLYDAANENGSITVWDSYGLIASMGNDWDDANGVKTDITEYIAGCSGCEFSLSVNATNWAWNGENDCINPLKIFFKVVSEDGTERFVDICSGPDSAEKITENSVDLPGCAELSFEETDTIYLCFMHGAGKQQYNEISFKVLGKVTAAAPVLTDDGANVIISNTKDKAAELVIYTVTYDSEKLLSSVKVRNITVQANTMEAAYTVEAKKGDTVYVWDISMKPLSMAVFD